MLDITHELPEVARNVGFAAFYDACEHRCVLRLRRNLFDETDNVKTLADALDWLDESDWPQLVAEIDHYYSEPWDILT